MLETFYNWIVETTAGAEVLHLLVSARNRQEAEFLAKQATRDKTGCIEVAVRGTDKLAGTQHQREVFYAQ